jgi:MFS family permease
MGSSSLRVGKQRERSFWWFILMSSLTYVAVDINVQGVMALLPFIRDEFALSSSSLGLYSSFLFLSSTLMAIIGGQFVDMLGSRRGMVGGILSVSILAMCHAWVPSYSYILALVLLSGFGFSLVTPSVNRAVIDWSPASSRGLAMGISQSGGCVGAVLGAALLPQLAVGMGWRGAVVVGGLLGIVTSLFLWFFYRERGTAPHTRRAFDFSAVKRLVKNRRLLFVCLLGIGFGSVNSSLLTHLAVFLNQDLGLDKTVAGLGLSALYLGGITGRLGWGWVGDRLLKGSSRRMLFIICMINVLMAGLFAGFTENVVLPTALVLFLVFLWGTTAVGWITSFFTAIGQLVDQESTGTATGLSLIFVRAGVVVSPPLLGYLADVHGSYELSWVFLGGLVLILACCFYWLTAPYERASYKEGA